MTSEDDMPWSDERLAESQELKETLAAFAAANRKLVALRKKSGRNIGVFAGEGERLYDIDRYKAASDATYTGMGRTVPDTGADITEYITDGGSTVGTIRTHGAPWGGGAFV